MSKKENLIKFWESLENSQRCQPSTERRDSSVIPQKLVVDRMLIQKIPQCLEKNLTADDSIDKEEQGSSSPGIHGNTEDNCFPHLPRCIMSFHSDFCWFNFVLSIQLRAGLGRERISNQLTEKRKERRKKLQLRPGVTSSL